MAKRKKIEGGAAVQGYVYRYTVIVCPECSSVLTEDKSLSVQLSVSGANPAFLTRLDKQGVLEDPEGNVLKGLHSSTECSTCGYDLYGHEQKFKDKEPPPLVRPPFPWSYDGVVALHHFPPGDLGELASKKIAMYLAQHLHEQLARGDAVDLKKEASDALAKLTKEVEAWAKAADMKIKEWRDNKRCTCGADRTGPSAEAHDDDCPAK